MRRWRLQKRSGRHHETTTRAVQGATNFALKGVMRDALGRLLLASRCARKVGILGAGGRLSRDARL